MLPGSAQPGPDHAHVPELVAQRIFGLARNARVFAEFSYRTFDTWSRARRVVGKAERLGDKDNPRFIVTSLSRRGEELSERVYCARGQMENRIKEQQGDLFGERLSSHGFAANQLRLWLSAFAYALMERLRAVALQGKALAQATAGTIRLRLRPAPPG